MKSPQAFRINDSASNTSNSNLDAKAINILNAECEGECKVNKIICVRIKATKVFITILLSLVSCLFVALMLLWSKKLRLKLLFVACSFKNCTHFHIQNSDATMNIVKRYEGKGPNGNNTIYFYNRYLKYFLSQEEWVFQPYEYNLSITHAKIHSDLSIGVDQSTASDRLMGYGQCFLNIPIPHPIPWMVTQLLNPFYIIQYACSILWIFEGYIMFAITMTVVSVVVTIISYIFMNISLRKLQKMAQNDVDLLVFRGKDNAKTSSKILSRNLIPGDIFAIEEKMAIPCDCILVSGELLMNESMLTGESIPMPKFEIENRDVLFDLNNDKRHFLFEGTKVLQTKPTKNTHVLALAVRTGYVSLKGQLLRTILFPKKITFGFQKQGLKYILSLGIICLAIFFIFLLKKMIDLNITTTLIVYRFLDVLTWIVPPALPIFMTIATIASLTRLGNNGVLGVVPDKVIVAGNVTHCCFDKTGTLTETGIDVYGHYEMENSSLSNLFLSKDSHSNDKQSKLIFKLMATCHGACDLNGEVVGDSLDVKMLEFSQHKLGTSADPTIKFTSQFGNSLLKVHRCFEFTSDLQRMSVVTEDQGANFYGFVKGAPEKIKEYCKPHTIPNEFNDVLEKMAIRGFRILALAYKRIQNSTIAQTISREELEADLEFIGLLVLQNKLKHDTREAIGNLRQAEINMKVISGDNVLTTIQAARESLIVNETLPVIVCQTSEDVSKGRLCLMRISSLLMENRRESVKVILDNEKEVEMENIKKPQSEKVSETLTFSSDEELLSHFETLLSNNQFEVALTGKAFEIFYNNNLEKPSLFYTKLMDKTRIFARMRPEQKTAVVEALQKMGITVGMVGDGANDCAALKQADCGISFAEADASFSAPFSSRSSSLKAVEKVFLEGRASLTNNIEIFRFSITSSFIKYTGVVILTYSAANLNDFQWLYINYLNIIPTLVFMALGRPVRRLDPKLPPDNLFGIENFTSMYGIMIIQAIGQGCIYALLKNQWWYVAPTGLVLDSDNSLTYNVKGVETATVLHILDIFFNAVAAAFVISSPWKLNICRNYLLSIWLLANTAYNSAIILEPSTAFGALDIFNKYVDGNEYLVKLFILIYGMSSIIILFEEIFVKRFIRNFERRKKKDLALIRRQSSIIKK